MMTVTTTKSCHKQSSKEVENVMHPRKIWFRFFKVFSAGILLLCFAGPSLGQPGGGPPNLAIYDIQDAGHTSPFDGQLVATSGIVTAVDSNSFYLQDPTGDNDNTTSDGIFIFTNSAPEVSVGDAVNVEGIVDEFIPGGASTNNLSITEIVSPTVEIQSSDNLLPAPVVLGAGGRIPPAQIIDNDNFNPFDPGQDGIDFFETLEGMRVTVQNALAVSPLNGFGEIFTVVDNGASATGLSTRRTINISPNDFNPERVQIQLDSGILSGFNLDRVNVRDQLGNVTGVVGYNFGNYEVNVTEPFRVRSGFLQPERTLLLPLPLRLRVASFNVLNLDPNDEEEDEDERDADVANGRFKAIAEIIDRNLRLPDIIALQEVQDNSGSDNDGTTDADETLGLLIEEIEARSGVTYAPIDNPFVVDGNTGGQPGGNIRVVFLYNPQRVELIENSVCTVIENSVCTVDNQVPFEDSRLPLVATFLFRGEEVTVVNNHFTSKGGSSPLFGQIQPSVAAGQDVGQEDPDINGGVDVRREQAQAVLDFVNRILTANRRANVVVLGDFNEFEFISPVNTLEASLLNLTETLPVNERYSFIFDGNSQSLDHILVSSSLTFLPFFDIVHVNSEFTETDARAADHDPLLASLFVKPQLVSFLGEK
jgi:predicted extracellular nuclease